MSIIIDNLILSSISEILNNNSLNSGTSLHINAAQDVIFKSPLHMRTQIDLNWCDYPLQDINYDGMLYHLIKMMDAHLKSNKQVLVNCFAGVSRSATIVVAYMMYKNKWTIQEAIDFVRSKRRIISPNYGFVCQLHSLQNNLHNLDENYNQIISEHKNKSASELGQEISELSKIPFITDIIKRELDGFDMP